MPVFDFRISQNENRKKHVLSLRCVSDVTLWRQLASTQLTALLLSTIKIKYFKYCFNVQYFQTQNIVHISRVRPTSKVAGKKLLEKSNFLVVPISVPDKSVLPVNPL